MKRQQSVGLVVEGNATSSAVLRLPSVLDEIGPVKAGVQRVARRLSNFLGAGYPVATYDELQDARLILLRVPDESVARIVSELRSANLVLKDSLIVLCESCMPSSVLAPLAECGAGTASVVAFPTPRKRWFVVEGHIAAVRQIKRLLDRSDARVFELKPGAKPLYFAAQLLATGVPIHLMTSAQQALRRAGIKGNHLHELLEEMSFEMFRSFSNGARFSWPMARGGCPPETTDEYLGLLRAHHPEIAADLEEQLSFASRRTSSRKSD
ncbi:MAG TPA: DUF2520 domain-containing protein [Bryobacteraceae bacterium]|jgi:predicted short-subunit dehydrogenase-like oxidoreductase (DUF2520 family)|nr:DUF2520 domain-containing protein [Bryobacteraceae bacterium]